MDLMVSVTCPNAEATTALGAHVGRYCHGGQLLALRGDLGSGKTTFVQGLATGLDVPDTYIITSPSYTLVNEYPGRLPLIHADLYRMTDAASLEDIGLDEWLGAEAVIAVEWSEKLPPSAMTDYLDIAVKLLPDDGRQFDFCAYGLRSGDLVDIVKRFHKE